jgi:hypothetical protein
MRSAFVPIMVAGVAIGSALLPAQSTTAVPSEPLATAQQSAAAKGSLEEQILSKEREGLDALKAGEPERFGELTADEAVLVDAHGAATKAQVLKNVAGFRLTDYSIEDVRFVPISAKSGLIAYKIHETGVSHGKEFTAQAYVSSLWTKRGKKWFCLFSQETGAR